MKQIIYIVIFSLFAISCDDFLEYKDKDKIIPSELDHYNELIMGELLKKSAGATCYNLWLMSDDYGTYLPGYMSSTSEDKREEYFSIYTWDKETQISPRGDERIDPAWENFYHKIVMCNVIEKEVGDFGEDVYNVKGRLLGEVQAIRAISYWYLVNMYGEPWRGEEQAKRGMGVPINNEAGIENKLYERSSLFDVYELIERDLNRALQNLEKGEQKNTIFRPNRDVVRLFLSRIYLEQKRYDEVIKICDEALRETKHTIISSGEMLTYKDDKASMLNKDNNSILFSWMDRDGIPGSSTSSSYGRYGVSEELIDLFASDDVRKSKGLLYDTFDKDPQKYKEHYSGCWSMNYRVEEFYFNRAEAYIESGEWKTGMEDLNAVYSKRLEGRIGELMATDVEQARRHLREDKRREFCFEDIRWFDIRRWGLAVEHKYKNFTTDGTYVTYVLDAESPNYVLPLPLDIQRRNFVIEQPKRVESKMK